MMSLRSLVPALALAGALAVAPTAEAAGGGYAQASSASSRASNGNTTVVSSRSMLGKTVTHYGADGSSRSVTEKRGLLGGRKVDVTHKDANGATTSMSSTKTGLGGDLKRHYASGAGWSTSTTTRTTLFGMKQTDHREHNADGTSHVSTTKHHRRSGLLMKSDAVDKDSAGHTTTTTERRGTFSQDLKRDTVVTDAKNKTVASSTDTFRVNDTIKKSVVRQNGLVYTTKFDRREREKSTTVTPAVAETPGKPSR